jgi:hypothetical protein
LNTLQVIPGLMLLLVLCYRQVSPLRYESWTSALLATVT